jgi:hypothetical protein
MRTVKYVSVMLGVLAVGLGTNTADARRLPGWAGIPDSPASTGCWQISASRLSLANACFDDGDHFFQIPITLDAASTTVTWRQGSITGAIGGAISGRVATISNVGTVISAPAFQSDVGLKSQFINVPSDGSAMLTIAMRSTAGLSSVFLSNVNWSPN